MLPIIWAIFAICTVGGFITIGAYWLDVQDRPDFTFRQRLGWSLAIIGFPVVIPIYAFRSGAGWPVALRIAAFLPSAALALFFGFLFGVFG